MTPQNRYLVFCWTVLFLGVACASKPAVLKPDTSASDDPHVEAVYRQARNAFEKGDYGTADEGFATLIRSHPKDPLARVALVYRARISLKLDNPDRARTFLETVRNGTDPVAERAQFYDAVALYQLGDFEGALKKLSLFEGRLIDKDENLTLLNTLWRTALGLEKNELALRYVDAFLAYAKDGAAMVEAKETAEKILDTMKALPPLERLKEDLPTDGAVWPMVMAKMAKIHLEAGRFEESASLLEAVEGESREQEQPVVEVAEEVADRFEIDLNAIGLLVPVSGRARLVGERVIKGVMLASKELGLQVSMRDTQSDPKRAAKGVEELVKDEHVSAIIGPLSGRVAVEAAKQAESLGVPLLLLSAKDGITDLGAFIFRSFATNAQEIRALVTKAKGMGHRRFSIAFPDSGFGRTMRSIYSKELLSQGLEMGVEVSYPPNAKEFKAQAEKLSEESFDVLFVPDSAGRVALIAPALAAAGLWSAKPDDPLPGPGRAFQLLLPSMCFSKDLLRRAGRYLSAALFATSYSDDAKPESRNYAELFYREYGGHPSSLSAFGYDGVRLVASALRDGQTHRDGIRKWLSETDGKNASKTLQTATPFAGFTVQGEPAALPWVYEVKDGVFTLTE